MHNYKCIGTIFGELFNIRKRQTFAENGEIAHKKSRMGNADYKSQDENRNIGESQPEIDWEL